MTPNPTCETSEQKDSPSKKENPKQNGEAALREKGLQLDAIVKAFDGLIYLCSQDYRIEYMNEKYIQRIGYDATGQICYKALHNRDSICPWCLINRILKGETVRCEVLTPKNNWYYVVSTPIYHPDGSFSKLAMIIDISGRKQAEESLRQSKKRLDLAMEATSDALWDWDLMSNKTYFNPCFYTMLGYVPYELPQNFETWRTLIHPEDKENTIHKLQEYIQKKIGSFEVEYRLKTKQGGWRWIMARGKVGERDKTGTPVRMVGTHVDITERKLNEEALRISEAHLRDENIRLRESFKGSNQFGNIIGKSKVMHEVYEVILKAALSNANVIIYGESGTGKELVAKTIHDLSNRGSRSFVTVNCGAIPDNLIESEFFGYTKGAFTGADMDKPGYLDIADGGTLFMDEVGELDPNLQVKLLRAVEGGGYTPVGSRAIKKTDIRIISATNRILKECVEKGTIRKDFYYRIHILPIHVPPLRERKEDISLLVYHFLQEYSDDEQIHSIPENIIKSMQSYDWPGNVRELQNTIHRYITLKEIDFMDIPQSKLDESQIIPESLLIQNNKDLQLDAVMKSVEKKYIKKLLEEQQWHKSKVASILGINRKTLFRKMKRHGIS
jgi:PAS domain S-box-containing protein